MKNVSSAFMTIKSQKIGKGRQPVDCVTKLLVFYPLFGCPTTNLGSFWVGSLTWFYFIVLSIFDKKDHQEPLNKIIKLFDISGSE